MQRKMAEKPVHKSSDHLIFTTLHDRIHELTENFSGFVQSECNWTADQYDHYLKNPGKCHPEDMKVILRIAGHLANDLKALVAREKKNMVDHKSLINI